MPISPWRDMMAGKYVESGNRPYTQTMPSIPVATPLPTPTPPVVIGLEPQAYEAVLYGKVMPVFIGGKLLMGGRIVEGPYYTPSDGDQLCDYVAHHALCADPDEARTRYEFRLRGQQAWTVGGGYLDTDKLPSGGLESRLGTNSQSALTQSVERNGAGAIAYRGEITTSVRGVSLRAFGGIVPFPSIGVYDDAYSSGIPRQVAIEKCLRYMRLDDDDFEVDVTGEDTAWIIGSQLTLQDFLQRLRSIFVHYNITYTDKLRIIEPTNFSISFNLSSTNLVRGSTRFGRGDPLLTARRQNYVFIDSGRDNEPNVAVAQEDVYPQPSTSAVTEETIELPIVTNSSQATADNWVSFYEKMAARNQMEGVGLPSLFGMEVGDGLRFQGDSSINSFMDKAVRAAETQHIYESWQVQFRGDEVLNCGVDFCASYELTEPEFVDLEHNPPYPLSYITSGAILGDYVYAVTNFTVICRVNKDTFASPQYLDISDGASIYDFLYSHAAFIYEGAVHLIAEHNLSGDKDVLRVSDDFDAVTVVSAIDEDDYELGGSNFVERVVIGDNLYLTDRGGDGLLRVNLQTGVTTFWSLPLSSVDGMVGDGERYIYVGGDDGISRLDTEDFGSALAITTVAIGGSPYVTRPTIAEGRVYAAATAGGVFYIASVTTGMSGLDLQVVDNAELQDFDWFGAWFDGCRYVYFLPENDYDIVPDTRYLARYDIVGGDVDSVSIDYPSFHPFQIGTDMAFDEDGTQFFAFSYGDFDSPPYDPENPGGGSDPKVVIAKFTIS